MHRRDATLRIASILGGALSAPVITGLLAGCRPPSGDGYVPRVLTDGEFQLVGQLSDMVIPETDTPGARAAGVDRFIDMMLAEFFDGDSRNGFLDALRNLAAGSTITDGRPFLSMSQENQLDVLTSLDAQAFPDPGTGAEPSTVAGRFFRQLKELVVSGYYTSEVGATMELHLPPFGAFRGDLPLADVERSWA